MRRREFIVILGGAAAVWPMAGHAQRPAKIPTIGLLGSTTASVWAPWTAAFVQRLRELGWIEGRTVTIDYRWAEGRRERYAEIAADFVRLKVDIIVTSATPPSFAAKQATSVIPIVFAAVGDPVGSGLVTSLARPGGNVTGLSIQGPDLAGKRLELLREAVPGLRRLAIMGNVGNSTVMQEMREVEVAARTLELEAATFEIRAPEDIAPVFEKLKGRVNALYVVLDPLTSANRDRINTLAVGARLPTMLTLREYVVAGGLMSVWTKLPRPVAARRRVCRQDSARGEAGRLAGRAANEIRTDRKSHDCQGNRPHGAAFAACPRRRAD